LGGEGAALVLALQVKLNNYNKKEENVATERLRLFINQAKT